MSSTHNTTTSLISDIKRITTIPINQVTFTEQDIIDYMNDEISNTILPLLMGIREEFFVTYTDTVLTTGVSELDIPFNAIGQRLRDVVLVHTTGGDEQLTNVPRLTIEQISSIGNIGYNGFYLLNNKIKFHPSTGWVGDTVRLYYFKRPSIMVKTTATAKIQAIDTNTNIITTESTPTAWTTSDSLDCINYRQPFNIQTENVTISLISGNNITVSSVTDCNVGDYLALAGESPFITIPQEAQQLLLQGVKLQMLDALGDTEGWKTSKVKYDRTETNLLDTLTPRVDGQYKKVVSNNNVFNYVRNRRRW